MASLFTIGVICSTLWGASAEVCTDNTHVLSEAAEALVQAHAVKGKVYDSYESLPQSFDESATAAYTRREDVFASIHCKRQNAVDVVAPIRNRKPVMFVHSHKAAGSTMCCEAHRRERVITPSLNCNHIRAPGWVGDGTLDSWMLWKPNPHRRWWTTCADRHAHMKSSNFTWRAIERELVDRGICLDHFVYVTILRKPSSGKESIMRFKADRVNVDRFPMRNIVKCIKDKLPTCQHDSPAPENYWKLFDNFMVRTFGGYDAMTAAPGGINSTHFNRAARVLQNFNLVLLLEHLSDRTSLDAMDHIIGWHLDPGHDDNSYDDPYYGRPVPKIEEQDLIENELDSLNGFDKALYALAEEWHAARR